MKLMPPSFEMHPFEYRYYMNVHKKKKDSYQLCKMPTRVISVSGSLKHKITMLVMPCFISTL
jgi:hypothetical protein